FACCGRGWDPCASRHRRTADLTRGIGGLIAFCLAADGGPSCSCASNASAPTATDRSLGEKRRAGNPRIVRRSIYALTVEKGLFGLKWNALPQHWEFVTNGAETNHLWSASN